MRSSYDICEICQNSRIFRSSARGRPGKIYRGVGDGTAEPARRQFCPLPYPAVGIRSVESAMGREGGVGTRRVKLSPRRLNYSSLPTRNNSFQPLSRETPFGVRDIVPGFFQSVVISFQLHSQICRLIRSIYHRTSPKLPVVLFALVGEARSYKSSTMLFDLTTGDFSFDICQ